MTMSFKKCIQTVLLFVLVVGLNSCEKNRLFDTYKGVPDAAWHKDSIVKFNVPSTDSLSKNNIYIQLRNNKDYNFSNLFLIVGIEFPNHYQIVDTLEYEMTSPEGRYLGTGMTDIKENILEYKTNVTFPVSGIYQFSIQHAMRKTRNIEGLEFLDGITDVGLQIEKVN